MDSQGAVLLKLDKYFKYLEAVKSKVVMRWSQRAEPTCEYVIDRPLLRALARVSLSKVVSSPCDITKVLNT